MGDLKETILETILQEYEETKDLNKVKQKTGLSMRKIKTELLYNGGKKGKEILLADLAKDFPLKEIIEGYMEGKMKQELSVQYNIPIGKLLSKISEYETITGEKIDKIRRNKKAREALCTDEIVEEYRRGTIMSQIAKNHDASISAVRKRIESYKIDNGLQIEEEHNRIIKAKKEGRIGNNNSSQQIQEDEIINLSLINKYFELGYTLSQIQKFAEENGYKIKKSDLETAKKIENKEVKIVSKDSLEKIVKNYEYSYEELTKIGDRIGCIVLKDMYDDIAKNKHENKNQEGEGR